MPESQPAGGIVYLPFPTRDSTGAPSAISGGSAVVYKNGNSTESSAGITLTPSFDAEVGQNLVTIDTSADGAFYVNGGQFWCKIKGTVASVSVLDTISFDLAVAIRDVRLADGVAHGGTPGSSTATLAVQAVNVTNNSASPALTIFNTAGPAVMLATNDSSGAMLVSSNGDGPAIEIQGYGRGGTFPVIQINSPGDNQAVIDIEAGIGGSALLLSGGSSGGGDAVKIIAPNNGHGINILAVGTGKKALLLAGDAATDALAIAAGAGTPINVLNADGTVNLDSLPAIATDWLTAAGVKADAVTKIQTGLATPTNITAASGVALSASGLNAITATVPSAVATTFPAMVVQLWWRFFGKTVKATSGTTVKTYASDGATLITTQTFADDGLGNETLNKAS